MRKDPVVDTVVEVSIKNDAQYLPRVKKITACLADAVGMDKHKASDTAFAITKACAKAMSNGYPHCRKGLSLRLTTSPRVLAAKIVEPTEIDSAGSADFSSRLMRALVDGVQFICRGGGLLVRFSKRVKYRSKRK